LISIVDDDAFVGESFRDLIESLGNDVAIFDSAERFLEAACLGETSCLITDLQMPGLSGLDLLVVRFSKIDGIGTTRNERASVDRIRGVPIHFC
jgi:FixJ family two-component response regulator